jgi:hypothetical protein
MKKIFLIIIALLTLNVGSASAQDEKIRVAVFDPTSPGTDIDEGSKIAIRELISSVFVNTGKYTIVERSLLEKVMKEQEFSNSGAVDDSQATEVGKLTGANKVILSVVTLVGERNMLSIKIINVQTATIDQQKTKIVSSDDLLDAIEPLTAELLGEEIPESEKSVTLTNTYNTYSSGKKSTPTQSQTSTSLVADDIIKSTANIITQACKKPEKYDSDEARFNSLKTTHKVSLERMIMVNSKFAIEPASVNDNQITFFLRNRTSLRTQWIAYIPVKVDDALVLFLDGELIGIGLASTGFVVTLPRGRFGGRHTLSLYACTFPIFNMSVDLSAKNYYLFDWDNKKAVKLLTADADTKFMDVNAMEKEFRNELLKAQEEYKKNR